MNLFKFLSIGCSIVLLLAPNKANAMGVTPLVIELGSGATNRSAQIVVNNDSSVNIPIELKVLRVELDETGVQQRSPAPSDFAIFPPARILPVRGKQVFRIQWAGSALTKSQTYVVVVSQPPVAMPGSRSGVMVDLQYEIIVNVSPPSGSRNLDALASSIVNQGGKRFANLLVGNSGNTHALLSDATITLRSGNWSRILQPQDLLKTVGVGVVQPGKRRKFVIPVELPQEATSVTAQITYRDTSTAAALSSSNTVR